MPQTVCAIIPTFNRANYIGECLDSLLAQSYPPDEIIVVDDGSTDTTSKVLEEYAEQVRYIKKQNGGKSSALNLAITRTNADYVYGSYQVFKETENGERVFF